MMSFYKLYDQTVTERRRKYEENRYVDKWW